MFVKIMVNQDNGEPHGPQMPWILHTRCIACIYPAREDEYTIELCDGRCLRISKDTYEKLSKIIDLTDINMK